MGEVVLYSTHHVSHHLGNTDTLITYYLELRYLEEQLSRLCFFNCTSQISEIKIQHNNSVIIHGAPGYRPT